jgi:hypothetical protein
VCFPGTSPQSSLLDILLAVALIVATVLNAVDADGFQ